jgi:amino acid permease
LSGEKTAARAALMKWVLIGYFIVLALGVAVPFAAASWLSNDQLGEFKEVMQQTSGLSQGLFGILGVVVGYYFKGGHIFR